MIAWPATPDKHLSSASSSSSKITGPSIERSASSNGKQCSLYEPSPATTYGEIATYESAPSTPNESSGKFLSLLDLAYRQNSTCPSDLVQPWYFKSFECLHYATYLPTVIEPRAGGVF